MKRAPRVHRKKDGYGPKEYVWCGSGRIIRPTPVCKHSFEAIIQPGDYLRIMHCWLAQCSRCRAMITGEVPG